MPTDTPPTDPDGRDDRPAEARNLRARALGHLAVGDQRILLRLRRRAAGRGFLLASPIALLLLLSPLAPAPSLALALAALLGGVAVAIARSARGASDRTRNRCWEEAELAADATAHGLVAAARDLLADPNEHPYAEALAARFLLHPLPVPDSITRALPPAPAGAIALVAVVLAVAAFVGRPGGAAQEDRTAGAPRTSSVADERASPPDSLSSNPSRLREELRARRGELALREELARLLGSAPELESWVAALREGGPLPELAPLSHEAVSRLRRAAVHAETRGAPEEWSDALRAAADGEVAVPDPGWIDLRARIAGLSAALVRGDEIGGRASAEIASLRDGGSAEGAEGAEAIEDPASGRPDDNTDLDAGDGRLQLPEGRPFAEGSATVPDAPGVRARTGGAPPTANDEPDDEWPARLEVEAHWFPVIDAYRRGGSPR